MRDQRRRRHAALDEPRRRSCLDDRSPRRRGKRIWGGLFAPRATAPEPGRALQRRLPRSGAFASRNTGRTSMKVRSPARNVADAQVTIRWFAGPWRASFWPCATPAGAEPGRERLVTSAQIGSPIASSKPTTSSSTRHAMPGEGSSQNLEQSPQSECATERRASVSHRSLWISQAC